MTDVDVDLGAVIIIAALLSAFMAVGDKHKCGTNCRLESWLSTMIDSEGNQHNSAPSHVGMRDYKDDGEWFEHSKPLEDNKQKDRISFKKELECFCLNMKTTIEDEKIADKISEDNKKKIIEINEAEVEEFRDKQKVVEGVYNPIFTKLQSEGATRRPSKRRTLI